MSKKIVICAIIVSIVASMSIAIAINTMKKDIDEISSTTSERAYGIEDIVFMEAGEVTEGSLCMVAPKGRKLIFYEIILDKYIYFRKIKGEEWDVPGELKGEHVEKYTEDIIELYNFKTGKVEKIIDFAAIANENTPGKQFRYWDVIHAKVIDGKPYLEWEVYPIEAPDNYEQSEIIMYDLEEGKVADVISSMELSLKYTEKEKEYFKSFYLIADQRCNFLEANNLIRKSVDEEGVYIIYPDGWQNGVIKVEMPASMLPESSLDLYGEFPQLKEYVFGEEDYVKFFFAGYPDAEEIMRMLIEDGTELTYEGCVIDSVGSVDGQQHEISCMDDYIKWCNWKQVSQMFE
ncbi:hypothetical protein AALA79_21615 [Lachnospiraceae bacterium 64-25]